MEWGTADRIAKKFPLVNLIQMPSACMWLKYCGDVARVIELEALQTRYPVTLR